MTTFSSSRIVLAFSAIGLAVSVSTFAAQAPKSTDRLTDKQVKALVFTAKTPADHTQLQKHFLALAAKSDAQAAKHADSAQEYRKPPVGRLMPGSAAKRAEHCERLSASIRAAANEARQLASDHERMAAGDQAQLQKYFLGVAANYDAEAAKHAASAQEYRRPPVGRLMPGSAAKRAQHCERLSASLRAAADQARQAAAERERMLTVNVGN
jgi:hypothetical protein